MDLPILRNIQFDLNSPFENVFIQDDPEVSYALLAISLMLPHVEPYLIKCLQQSLEHIKDESLKQHVDLFCRQEAQHASHHKKFNQAFLNHYPKLPEFEEELKNDYKTFLAKRPLEFNLAYAKGFETLTSLIAILCFNTHIVEKSSGVLADIFIWHSCEELEHKEVVFEAYQNIYPAKANTKSIAYGQLHAIQWVLKVTRYLMKTDKQLLASDYPSKKINLKRYIKLTQLVTKLGTRLAKTYLPNYHPRQLDVPEEVLTRLKDYQVFAV